MTEPTRTLETLELVGGVLCLDFVNTVNSRPDPEHDYLLHYSDLLGWANKVGILSAGQKTRLQKWGQQNTAEAETAIQAAHTYRDLFYGVFSNIARGSEADPVDLNSVVVFYANAIEEVRPHREGNHYKIYWDVEEALDAVLWPVLHSAGELLLFHDLSHVKECPGCGWLFLDTSKNQSRRWCSMNTCGARDKMRRYHKRQRAA